MTVDSSFYFDVFFISKNVYNFLEAWAEMLSVGVCDKKVRSILLSSYLQETQSSGNWKPTEKAASSSSPYTSSLFLWVWSRKQSAETIKINIQTAIKCVIFSISPSKNFI